MEGKDMARSRIRIGMIAEDGLGARRDIFETDLSFIMDEVLGHAGNVARGLLRKAGKRAAFGLGFDHSAELPAYEQAVVNGARGCLEFAHRHAKPGAEIHLCLGLNQPPTSEKTLVDQ